MVKRLLIIGLVCTLGGPAAGFLLTIAGMVSSFKTLGQNGVSDPSILAGHIGSALIATEIGVMIGILGLPLIAAALILQFRKPPAASP